MRWSSVARNDEPSSSVTRKTGTPSRLTPMLCIGAMTVAVQFGLSYTLANQAIIIFLFELIVAAISSWWWVNETLNAQEWIGAAMIITGSLFSGQLEKSSSQEKPYAR